MIYRAIALSHSLQVARDDHFERFTVGEVAIPGRVPPGNVHIASVVDVDVRADPPVA